MTAKEIREGKAEPEEDRLKHRWVYNPGSDARFNDLFREMVAQLAELNENLRNR